VHDSGYKIMPKILIVDDDYSDYLFVKDSLEESLATADIIYAAGYNAALDLVTEQATSIDFLILDFDLGAKKGDELYHEIAKVRDIPSVFLTGNLNRAKLDKLGNLAVLDKDNLDLTKLAQLIQDNTSN